jgi:hypothetical protein
MGDLLLGGRAPNSRTDSFNPAAVQLLARPLSRRSQDRFYACPYQSEAWGNYLSLLAKRDRLHF